MTTELTFKRKLELLSGDIDYARWLQRHATDPKELYWAERLERAAHELMLRLVPDQLAEPAAALAKELDI